MQRHSRIRDLAAARIARSESRGACSHRRHQRGYSTLGGCLAIVALIAGIGLIRIMGRIHHLTQTQVQLDHCTGTFIANLRGATLTMVHSYERLEAYRATVALACVTALACKPALDAYRIVVKFEKGIQKTAQIYWWEQQKIWQTELTHRCQIQEQSNFLTRFLLLQKSSFPEFPFPVISGNLTDLASIKSTQYLLNDPSGPIELRLKYLNLTSTAELKKEMGSYATWKIRWTQ